MMTTTEAAPAPEQQDSVSPFATTVSSLVVNPQMVGVNMSFNTSVAVRAQLQVGSTSGTYPTKGPITNQVKASNHALSLGGLVANTTYHYIIQFYDGATNALDATTDATFVTLAAPASGTAPGAIIGPLLYGSGVPANSMGTDGNFYFRVDGGAGTAIYQRRAGVWVATAA